jgi:hypothetical protein
MAQRQKGEKEGERTYLNIHKKLRSEPHLKHLPRESLHRRLRQQNAKCAMSSTCTGLKCPCQNTHLQLCYSDTRRIVSDDFDERFKLRMLLMGLGKPGFQNPCAERFQLCHFLIRFKVVEVHAKLHHLRRENRLKTLSSHFMTRTPALPSSPNFFIKQSRSASRLNKTRPGESPLFAFPWRTATASCRAV